MHQKYGATAYIPAGASSVAKISAIDSSPAKIVTFHGLRYYSPLFAAMSLLFAAIRCYLLLFAAVRCYSLLFVSLRCYSLLCAAIRCYLVLFPVIRCYSLLFVVI